MAVAPVITSSVDVSFFGSQLDPENQKYSHAGILGIWISTSQT